MTKDTLEIPVVNSKLDVEPPTTLEMAGNLAKVRSMSNSELETVLTEFPVSGWLFYTREQRLLRIQAENEVARRVKELGRLHGTTYTR